MQNLLLSPELGQGFLPHKAKEQGSGMAGACRKDDRNQACSVCDLVNPPSQGLNPQGSEEGERETTDSGKTPKPELLPRPLTGSEFLCETTTPS